MRVLCCECDGGIPLPPALQTAPPVAQQPGSHGGGYPGPWPRWMPQSWRTLANGRLIEEQSGGESAPDKGTCGHNMDDMRLVSCVGWGGTAYFCICLGSSTGALSWCLSWRFCCGAILHCSPDVRGPLQGDGCVKHGPSVGGSLHTVLMPQAVCPVLSHATRQQRAGTGR